MKHDSHTNLMSRSLSIYTPARAGLLLHYTATTLGAYRLKMRSMSTKSECSSIGYGRRESFDGQGFSKESPLRW